MTTAEKNALKAKALEDCVAALRHIVRHNGAALSAKASLAEVAEHCTEVNRDRVATMWQDINTIDRVKHILRNFPVDHTIKQHNLPVELIKPEGLTTEQVAALAVNDPTVAVAEYNLETTDENGKVIIPRRDWAVVRITKTGAEILSYGGGFYQGYTQYTTSEEVTEEVTDETTGETTTQTVTVNHYSYVQEGDTELLLKALESEDAAWLAESWKAALDGTLKSYTEGGQEFYTVPCELPGDLSQLILIRYKRVAADGSAMDYLEYSLTDNSCDVSNEGMVALPHGSWLIYDNSNLESAPKALLVPKSLVDEGDVRLTGVEIVYNELVSGLARLRLVGDSFGDEYIVSTQDFYTGQGGTWTE